MNRQLLLCELCVRNTCTCSWSCTAPPIVVDVPDSRICTASTSTPTPPFLYQILFLPTAGSVFRDPASHNSGSLVLQSLSLYCAISHALVSTVACRQEGHSSPLSETVPWKIPFANERFLRVLPVLPLPLRSPRIGSTIRRERRACPSVPKTFYFYPPLDHLPSINPCGS